MIDLDRLTPYADVEVQWPALRLRLRAYAGGEVADDRVTSVRAVVFKGGSVVVVRENDGARHCVPGGRREPGETLEETVRREVLEECGWAVGPLEPLGFVWLEPLGEPPADHPYAWRPFAHRVFVAEAITYDRRALRRAGEPEAGSRLTPVGRALAELPPYQAATLRQALAVRRSPPSARRP